jgi:hypothetical protein
VLVDFHYDHDDQLLAVLRRAITAYDAVNR